jgi:DNA-binding winged helix-turn-helix (wHTH) protein
MAASLEHANGDHVGSLVSLDRDEILIGRTDNCSLVTETQFTSVSQRHAVLQRSITGWTITDIGTRGKGSTYGTYLNNERLVPNVQVVLHAGDVIRLGTKLGKYFTFHDSDTVTTSLPSNLGDRISLDTGRRQVLIDGQPVMLSLTPHEFDLLVVLWGKHGDVCLFREICDALWPGEKIIGPGSIDSDLRIRVNTLAYTARRKIENVLDGLDVIESCRGIGYRWRV